MLCVLSTPVPKGSIIFHHWIRLSFEMLVSNVYINQWIKTQGDSQLSNATLSKKKHALEREREASTDSQREKHSNTFIYTSYSLTYSSLHILSTYFLYTFSQLCPKSWRITHGAPRVPQSRGALEFFKALGVAPSSLDAESYRIHYSFSQGLHLHHRFSPYRAPCQRFRRSMFRSLCRGCGARETLGPKRSSQVYFLSQEFARLCAQKNALAKGHRDQQSNRWDNALCFWDFRVAKFVAQRPAFSFRCWRSIAGSCRNRGKRLRSR